MIWKNYSPAKNKRKIVNNYEIKLKEKNPFLSVSTEELDENIREATNKVNKVNSRSNSK